MRILKLMVEGFTCYRKQVELDLSDLHLFAITGPTGSGKSSLVDAMIFALYGRVPRVTTEVSHLISQGLPKAYVLLEFTVGNQRYKVGRSLHITKGSQAILDSFEEEQWRGIASGVRQVNQHILQILGLDYDAFTRCIVLPQGEFQNFLHDSKGRQDILTHLLGLEILGEMQKEASQNYDITKERMKTIQQRLDEEFAQFQPEQIQGLQEQYQNAVTQIARVQNQLELLSKQYQEQQEVWQLLQRIQKDESLYQSLIPKNQELEQLEQKIALTRRILPVRPQLEQYKTLSDRLSNLVQKQRTLDAKNQDLQAQYAAHQIFLERAIANYALLPQFEARLEMLKEAKQLYSQLALIQQKRNETSVLYQAEFAREQEIQKQQRMALNAKQTLQQQLQQIQQQLQTCGTRRQELLKFQGAEPLLQLLKEAYEECQRKTQSLKEAWQARDQRQQYLQQLIAAHQVQETRIETLQRNQQAIGDKAALQTRSQQLDEAYQIQERIQYHRQEQEKELQKLAQDAAMSKDCETIVQGLQQKITDLQQQVQQLQKEWTIEQERKAKLAQQWSLYQEALQHKKIAEGRLADLAGQQQQTQKAREHASQQLQANRAQQQELQAKLEQYKKEWLQAYTQEVASKLRQHLELDCPCPVCGQKVHKLPPPIQSQFAWTAEQFEHAVNQAQQAAKTIERAIAESEAKIAAWDETDKKNQAEMMALQQQIQTIDIQLQEIQAILATVCKTMDYEKELQQCQTQCNLLEKGHQQSATNLQEHQTQMREKAALAQQILHRMEERQETIQAHINHIQTWQSRLQPWIQGISIAKARDEVRQALAKIEEIQQQLLREEKNLADLTLQKELASQDVAKAEKALKNAEEEKDLAFSNYGKKQDTVRQQLGMNVVQIGQTIADGLKQLSQANADWEKLQQQKSEITGKISERDIALARQETALQEIQTNLQNRQKALAEFNHEMEEIKHKIQEITQGEPVDLLLELCKKQKQDIQTTHSKAQEQKLKLDQTIHLLQEEQRLLHENIQQTQTEHQALEMVLQKLAVEFQVSQFQDLLRLETDVEMIPIWEKQLLEQRLQLREIENRLKSAREQLAGRFATQEALVQTQQEIDSQNKQLASCMKDQGRLTQLIQHAEEAARQAQSLQKEMLELQKKEGVQKQLALDLRSNRFQSYVLGQAIKTLAEDGSIQLDLLSDGRYAFVADDRELQIMDHWNQDELRPAKTLSGGETFIASLSLALALAERIYQLGQQSGGSAALESLFLDEGFGNLDEDYLDIVVKALSNLQGTGRMIGIISHLPILNNYMPARIVVQKEREGSSIEKIKT